MSEVGFGDVSIRDGQLSVWAANITIGMMLRAAPYIDEAGLEPIVNLAFVVAAAHRRILRGEGEGGSCAQTLPHLPEGRGRAAHDG